MVWAHVVLRFSGSGLLHLWRFLRARGPQSWMWPVSRVPHVCIELGSQLVFGAVFSPRPYILHHIWVMDWWGVKMWYPCGPTEAPPSSTMCVMWGMSWFSSRVHCLWFPYWGSRPTAGSPCLAYCCSLLHSGTLITRHTHTPTCIHSYTLGCWRVAGHCP